MSDVKLDPIKVDLISRGLVSDQGRRLVGGGKMELLFPLPPGLISCQCNVAKSGRGKEGLADEERVGFNAER